jgi:hypothetical protein
MKVLFELDIRVDKLMTQDEKDELKTARLLPNFDEDEFFQNTSGYRYVPMTIDLANLGPYSYYDDDHTTIRLIDYQAAYLAHIPYDTFQGILEATLGFKVKSLKDYHVIMKQPRKSS